MRTYFITITSEDASGMGSRFDFVVFDSLEQCKNFAEGKSAYNALDDSTHLYHCEQIEATFCVLADNVLEAYHRAFALKDRVRAW